MVIQKFVRKFATGPKIGSTFSNQNKLPRLPIPTLAETAEKYLGSLKPLLSTAEFEASQKAVSDFISPGGIGEKLQQRLIEYDKTQKNSWLEDIWYKKAYLEWREPTMINVNWWLQFKDSEDNKLLVKSPPPKGEFSSIQVSRAAGIISNLLNFKDLLESEQLAPETMGRQKIPVCMNQYKMQFGVTRIPKIPGDIIRQEFPCSSKHIILMIEGQIYVVNVLGPNGERLPIKAIEQQLDKAVSLHKSVDEKQPEIGLLTSENRDVWAKCRENLISIDKTNKNSLESIETALFAVCLENFSTAEDVDLSHRVIFYGAGGRNRWFDKSLQFVFMNNGRGGCNGEHSPSDAVVAGSIMEYVLQNEPAKNPDNAANVKVHVPKRLEWKVDEFIKKAIDTASVRAETDIEDTDSVLLHFNGYGGELIKSNAKASPDAFIQMALQLAYFRTYNESCPTYESASTRQFLHGRTETIRTCSVESVAFSQAFDETDSKDEKIQLLRSAIDSHVKYARDATNGRGVDRHLLGLRMMLQRDEKVALFEDPAYMKSMCFTLSTSNISPGDNFYGGFGPVMPDGYGINYAIGKDKLKFSIASRRAAKDTCSRSFRKVLEGTLLDMMNLFSDGKDHINAKDK